MEKSKGNIRKKKSKSRDIQESLVQIRRKVLSLKGRVSILEKELEKYKKALQKAQKDYQSLQKRIKAESEQAVFEKVKQVAAELIAVSDDIYTASTMKNKISKEWVEGIMLAINKIPELIDNLGIEKISVKRGDKFDPSLHEAISTQKGKKPNTIAKVIQNGFLYKGRLIRPARVIVYI